MMNDRVRVCSHPVFGAFLTEMRNKETSPERFRHLAKLAGRLLAYEATHGIETVPHTVMTPLAEYHGTAFGQKVGLFPIMRAGNAMIAPFQELLPHAHVWHLGMRRDEETFKAVWYYEKVPQDLSSLGACFILDPMLATGGSAVAAATFLKERRARRIIYVGFVSAPDGIKNLHDSHPDVQIFVGAADAKLNERAYIVPGLGDFGDRVHGTE